MITTAKVINNEEVTVSEIVIDVQNKNLTTSVFSDTLRTYSVHISDLFNGTAVAIQDNPRKVQNGEAKGYYAASIANGRVATSALVDVLTNLAAAKNTAFEARRGRNAEIRARRQADLLTPAVITEARKWFHEHTTSIKFTLNAGDVSTIANDIDPDMDPKVIDDINDSILKKQASFFKTFNVKLDPDYYYESPMDDVALGHNVKLTWRRVEDNPEKALAWYKTQRGTSCEFSFNTEIAKAPTSVKNIIKNAKVISKKANATVKEDVRGIACYQLGITVINHLFNGNLNFLADPIPVEPVANNQVDQEPDDDKVIPFRKPKAPAAYDTELEREVAATEYGKATDSNPFDLDFDAPEKFYDDEDDLWDYL